jgi:hypothetical protein
MAHDTKIVSLAGQRPMQRFFLPQALVRLRDASGQSLQRVLATFFDRADDALFELADRASTNLDQTAYFDAMRELRLRRKAMSLSVLQYVSQAFNDIGKFKPRQTEGALGDVDQDSLSLLDHAQLEQQVAVDNLINKLRNRYIEQIRLLAVRVNHVVPSITLADSQMPLSPEVICGGVAEACGDLDIDIRAKLVVLKLFDRLLADSLGDFYQEANRTLVAEGVLPDMKRPPVGPTRAGRGSPTPGPAPNAGRADSSPAGPEGDVLPGDHGGLQPTFSELSALLHPPGQPASAPAASGAGYLDTVTLMAGLHGLQAASGHWQPDQVVTLNEQLGPVLTAENGASYNLGQVDNDVINLVAMLFDFILEDRQLHPIMKSLIGRLQIPVLKVALSDKNFFNRGGHPVRKLLNELALSAMGWSEKRAGQRDPLRDKIESVVERVLTDFTDNLELFEDLLAEFRHFMDLDRRRRELVEQRLRDAEEGRARQETAAQAAEGLVQDLLRNRDVPAPVGELLRDAWTRYLQWIVLREGEASERWAEACELSRRLVWSVDPRPVSDTTRSELLRAIPSVVDGVRRAMQEISWDPFATDAAIRDLELAHVDVFQRLVTQPQRAEPAMDELKAVPVESEAAAPNLAPEPVSAPSEPGVEASAQAEAPDRLESTAAGQAPVVGPEWLAQADGLRVGSWIEMTREDTKVRCKLAAFIKATGKYIFVNRSGAKVAEYLREELAGAMAAGEIGMLDDGLIFDRALESIIDNLRSSRKD